MECIETYRKNAAIEIVKPKINLYKKILSSIETRFSFFRKASVVKCESIIPDSSDRTLDRTMFYCYHIKVKYFLTGTIEEFEAFTHIEDRNHPTFAWFSKDGFNFSARDSIMLENAHQEYKIFKEKFEEKSREKKKAEKRAKIFNNDIFR